MEYIRHCHCFNEGRNNCLNYRLHVGTFVYENSTKQVLIQSNFRRYSQKINSSVLLKFLETFMITMRSIEVSQQILKKKDNY